MAASEQLALHALESPADVTTDDSRVDPVAAGFDAAIHSGEFIAQDMVAVRVSPDIQPAIVGAPSYFKSHSTPTSPRDLLSHRCINFRHRGESVYKWELDRGDESVAIAVSGPLVLDDEDLLMQAAIDGAGLALVANNRATPHIAQGELIRVMEDWTPPFPGVLSLLSPPEAAASYALGADRHASHVDAYSPYGFE